ncbi:putative NADH:quinone oxidoreductase/Mrp antiporter, membrane subunit [Helianthus anomalus]
MDQFFFNFRWKLGIDGLSLGPVLLTGFITTLATLAAWPVIRDSRLFHLLMLAIYSEFIPVYLLLSMWGGKKRLYSATKFILYTAGGFHFSLIGRSGCRLSVVSCGFGNHILYWILIAFAVKLLILPLHTWLPDTHEEAHYSTYMLLVGILLKMGAYGLIRINMELLPHAHSIFSPWLMVVGTIHNLCNFSISRPT